MEIIGDRGNRKSIYDPDLARRVNEEVEREERQRKLEEARRGKAGGKPTEEPPAVPSVVTPPILSAGDYILMPIAKTYALGLHGLQKACIQENNQAQPWIILPNKKKVSRANTFLEDILARMNDWETLTNPDGTPRTGDERKRYFTTWLDSSCGIAYKANTTKLKLQLVCPQLMGIAKDFNRAFLPVDYASFSGIELNSSSRNFVQDGWLALLEGKTDVYQNYLAILKAITGRDIVPDFWKLQNTATDELRAVCVCSLDGNSVADGNVLNYIGRFLRRRSP